MKLLSQVAALSTLLLAACGSSDAEPGAGTASTAAKDPMAVTVAFYPLEWASERVGGDLVNVTNLTKPGGEPHDIELTPKAVADLAASDVVVYLTGFQPAVDDAVKTQAGDAAFDVSGDADLTIPATQESEEEPAEEGALDPHFWLDPVRLEGVGKALAERFATADPDNAQTYRANAATMATDLQTLHTDFEKRLADCANTALVTGHTAFAYLADRYGFSQQGIAGVSPDAEPDAATIREIVAFVEAKGVTTVYSETLVSPALSETIARESGAKVAVLDPIEGLTDSSAGEDYLEVMRSNLATLHRGQVCR